MNFVTLAALGLAFGYSVLQKAGVILNDWNLVLLFIGIAASVHFFWQRRQVPRLDRVVAFSAIAVLCFAAIQLLPLPVSLVRMLSPNRIELLNAALPVTGGSRDFVTLSATPNQTAEYLLTLGAYFLVYLLVRDLGLRLGKWPWITVWPVLIVAGLEAALGLAQYYAAPSGGVATGTYANRDHYAGLLEMALPLAAMYPVAIMQRGRDRFGSPAAPAISASLLAANAVMILASIVFSLSRMGFISALAALLVAGSTALSLRGWQADRAVRSPRWRRWAPTALVTLVIVLGFVFLPTDPLVARFANMASGDQIPTDTRVQIWWNTASVIKAYPLFGCGLGGFESCLLRYKTVAPMFTVDYAHNDYLQVLAELGVFGFCAGLVFVLRIYQQTVRAVFHAHSVDERYLAIACMASMTAILLHSFVDFNMYVPANGMLFAWISAASTGGRSYAPGQEV